MGFSFSTLIPLISASRTIAIAYIMLPKLDENSTQTIKDDEELHVFIFDDQETTIQKCLKIYSSRTRINKEYWLFDTTNVTGQVF